MNSAVNIIALNELSKIYQIVDVQVKALDGISLQIQPGEFVAIMGPSGSGKSTLLNILGCLDHPTSGTYLLGGEDVSALSREKLAHVRNRKIGFIFQSYNLLSSYTALENVMVPLVYSRNGKLSHAERLQRAQIALQAVALADRAKHKPAEMSGGQQQRVAIARALINDPLLILADEPTGNLDSQSGAEIMGILRDLHERGRTIVLVTHESEVAAYAQRTIHLRDGRIEIDHRNGVIPPGTPPVSSAQEG